MVTSDTLDPEELFYLFISWAIADFIKKKQQNYFQQGGD